MKSESDAYVVYASRKHLNTKPIHKPYFSLSPALTYC